jgi:hypothetical protein
LYFPTQVLLLESASTLNARYTIVVARAAVLQSQVRMTVQSDYSGLPGGSPIKKISLVE